MYQYDAKTIEKDRKRKNHRRNMRKARRPIVAAINKELLLLQTTFEKEMFQKLNNGEADIKAATAYIRFNSM